MTSAESRLHVVMYHYVRDLPRTKFPAIKGMMPDCFKVQVDKLRSSFEMATLAIAMEFLTGTYKPRRDLCLLTFDDGLSEHYEYVTPILSERGIQGVFFLITSALAESRVAPVHMNHFLTAKLGFEEYVLRFEAIRRKNGISADSMGKNYAAAQKTYPWDPPEVASFKYAFNFTMNADERDRLVKQLFENHVAEEKLFARELYVDWSQAREMQLAGMVMGGHTHVHRPLATLADSELNTELRVCRTILQENLKEQLLWPFCYPYGKRDSFDTRAVHALKELGFDCAFSTDVGPCAPGADLFSIPRLDCNRVEYFQPAS